MMAHKYILSLLPALLLFSFSGKAQDEIFLSNPSFEVTKLGPYGTQPCCKAPRGWYPCGGPDLGTPDIQPGHFGVALAPAEGNFYLGMVTRDNDTWEVISQRLRSAPLKEGQCYTFSLKVSYAPDLVSQSRLRKVLARYNNPVKVRLWGGSNYCNKQELLDETPPIQHSGWKQYNFRFEPKATHEFFILEVFYKTPTPVPYNGNVLIDDCSSIKQIPCDEEREPEEEPVPPKPPIEFPDPLPAPPPTPDPKPIPTPDPNPGLGDQQPKPSPGPILGLDPNKMKEGQVIRIKKLYFLADSSNIQEKYYPVLDEIYDFLRWNKEVTVELGGHTNNRCGASFCDELSEKRAKAVVDYLIGKGIRRNRLTYKGYGKRNPVSTNATTTGRRNNQRVEVKIISMDG